MDGKLICKIDFNNIDTNEELDNVLQEINAGEVDIPRIGNCEIWIYEKERNIPHFHVISEDGSFESCVRIFEPLYFPHEGKDDIFIHVLGLKLEIYE